jgi:ribonuclease P protein subunit RPR2
MAVRAGVACAIALTAAGPATAAQPVDEIRAAGRDATKEAAPAKAPKAPEAPATEGTRDGGRSAEVVPENASAPAPDAATAPAQAAPTARTPVTGRARQRAASRTVRVRRSPARTASRAAAPRPRAADPGRRARARRAARRRAAGRPAARRERPRAAREASDRAPRAPRAHEDEPQASIARAARETIAVVPGWLRALLGALVAATLAQALRAQQVRRRGARTRARDRSTAVRALAGAVAARDGCTGRHIDRVSELALLLAREVAPRDAGDPQMAFGFLLHDVGKLSVPDAILRKAGPLTEAEFRTMRRHPDDGARILRELGFLDAALDVVRHHHERWDGRGYPDGLAGARIPLWARIFAVADTVDAITSRRPYRRARSLDDAIAVLRAESGGQFDPECVDAFLRLDRDRVTELLETPRGDYEDAAARIVPSKSVRGIGPTQGEVTPAAR